MHPIKLSDHPSNLDPTAVLVTTGMRTVGRDIFRTAGGFVACLPAQMAVPGTFETQRKAEQAQKRCTEWSEAIWGRLVADNAASLDDAEIERVISPCVCGPRLVPWAKALRDGGMLAMDNGEIVLRRPEGSTPYEPLLSFSL